MSDKESVIGVTGAEIAASEIDGGNFASAPEAIRIAIQARAYQENHNDKSDTEAVLDVTAKNSGEALAVKEFKDASNIITSGIRMFSKIKGLKKARSLLKL